MQYCLQGCQHVLCICECLCVLCVCIYVLCVCVCTRGGMCQCKLQRKGRVFSILIKNHDGYSLIDYEIINVYLK